MRKTCASNMDEESMIFNKGCADTIKCNYKHVMDNACAVRDNLIRALMSLPESL